MKNFTLIITLIAIVLNSLSLYAQEKEGLTYTVLYNQVNKDANFPLIGFVNLAKKSHTGLQLGFTNTTLKQEQGAQIGFINTTIEDIKGAQIGFINSARNTDGTQVGFVNISPKKIDGTQIGFINYSKATEGAQISFINSTKTLRGAQLGFINIVDTIEKGIAFGFLTFAKKGGYQSIELSSNETYPLNLSYKIGLRKLYTFIQGSYNNTHVKEYGLGAGIGTLIQLSNKFYMSPETYIISSLGKNNYHGVSLSNVFRFALNKHIHIAAGPSIMWMRNLETKNCKTSFLAVADKIYKNNDWLIFGFKTAVSFEIK